MTKTDATHPLPSARAAVSALALALVLLATPAMADEEFARPAPAAMQDGGGERSATPAPAAIAADGERLNAEQIHRTLQDQLVAGVRRPKIDLSIQQTPITLLRLEIPLSQVAQRV